MCCVREEEKALELMQRDEPKACWPVQKGKGEGVRMEGGEQEEEERPKQSGQLLSPPFLICLANAAEVERTAGGGEERKCPPMRLGWGGGWEG